MADKSIYEMSDEEFAQMNPPEIVEDGVNGYLIHPGNKGELKQAIDSLITNTELRRKMGKESQCMVGRFLPESVIRQLSDLYKLLLVKSL